MNRRGFLAGAVGAAVAPVVPAASEISKVSPVKDFLDDVGQLSIKYKDLSRGPIIFQAHWINEGDIDFGWISKFGHLHGYEKDGSGI